MTAISFAILDNVKWRWRFSYHWSGHSYGLIEKQLVQKC